MNVTIADSAEIGLRNMREDDRREVWAWIENLEKWETDSYVREHSKRLDSTDNVHMLLAGPNFRVFFRLEEDRISVEDVTTSSMIASFGRNSGAK